MSSLHQEGLTNNTPHEELIPDPNPEGAQRRRRPISEQELVLPPFANSSSGPHIRHTSPTSSGNNYFHKEADHDDVEAPKDKKKKGSAVSVSSNSNIVSRTSTAASTNASPAAAFSNAAATTSHHPPPANDLSRNPIVLTKIILRKVIQLIALVATAADYDRNKPGLTIIVALKDIIIGMLWGSIVLFIIEHRRYTNVDSIKSLIINPENVKKIEESTGWKIMCMPEWDIKHGEITGLPKQLEEYQQQIDQFNTELKGYKEEIKNGKKEYDDMILRLGLDKYCGDCVWGGGKTCDQRVDYLQGTYKTPKWEARISAMKKPNCVRK
mmetsp:Transcript_37101/g.78311  ORF Transcript_37101/g.78311 Transcript_37101/m.78311 type:complete len:325 (+) Transcript_37101:85-1059(+)